MLKNYCNLAHEKKLPTFPLGLINLKFIQSKALNILFEFRNLSLEFFSGLFIVEVFPLIFRIKQSDTHARNKF